VTGGDIEELELQFGDLDFNVSKSLRYYMSLRSRWARLDRYNKAAGLLSGGLVIGGVIADSHFWTAISGGLVAILSGMDLILDFGRHERLYEGQYRRFSSLGQKVIDPETERSLASLRKLQRERREIEADDPTLDRWLERRCSRDEAIARALPVNDVWLQTRWDFVGRWKLRWL
jgi:hypothetical protein